MNLVEQNKSAIIELCESHNVVQLFIFGSVLSERFNFKSDVDFLVKFGTVSADLYFDNYMDLKEKLASTLKRQVDLIENQTIKNPILRKVIDREKILVYDRESIEVPV